MDKKTKVIVTILIIIVIILTIYVGILIYNLNNTNELEENNLIKEEQNITTENIVNQNEIKEENIVENNSIEEQNTSTEQNAIVDNSNNIIGKEESDSQTSNQGLSNDEKAIQLAKNKYGNVDNTVKFNIANKNGNEYYISVNNVTTTRGNSMV